MAAAASSKILLMTKKQQDVLYLAAVVYMRQEFTLHPLPLSSSSSQSSSIRMGKIQLISLCCNKQIASFIIP
jgi:hypothetical protein